MRSNPLKKRVLHGRLFTLLAATIWVSYVAHERQSILMGIAAIFIMAVAIFGASGILLWLNFTENVSAFPGIDTSATCYTRSENVCVLPIVVPKFKIGNVEQNVFGADLVERAERSDDSTFDGEYRPNRTHRVTTGLDPVVHGDIRRTRRDGETERAGSLHGLPDQVRQ
jgi:hypothetical protein